MEIDRKALEEWQRDQPLCILQLDAADRTVLKVADERDAIQKKTFTKWVNKHLEKAGYICRDLFEDLRDGHNLLFLLEVLSGQPLPRERGRMRFHAIQNVETALKFLRYKNIKLVNIRGEDIVDANPKLTLGLVWTIILHFQISDIIVGQGNVSAKEALLRWAQKTTTKYPHVNVKDFISSWRDGFAFCAVVHRNRPDLLDWQRAAELQPRERIDLVFTIMENTFGVTRLLDPEDVDIPQPDEKSLITYISQLYDVFPNPPSGHPLIDQEYKYRFGIYQESAKLFLNWIRNQTIFFQDKNIGTTLPELQQIFNNLKHFYESDLPLRQAEKSELALGFREINALARGSGLVIPRELNPDHLDRAWKQMLGALKDKQSHVTFEIKRIMDGKKIANSTNDPQYPSVELKTHGHFGNGFSKETDKELKSAIENNSSQHENSKGQNHLFKNGLPHHEISSNIKESTEKDLLMVQNDKFLLLFEAKDWISEKIAQIKSSCYGAEIYSILEEIEAHKMVEDEIEEFSGKIEECQLSSITFSSQQAKIFNEKMADIGNSYQTLQNLSNKRKLDLELLHDFVFAVNDELDWIQTKEIEATRGWSNRKLQEIDEKFQRLCFEMNNRKAKLLAVQDQGEALIIAKHPTSPLIESKVSLLKTRCEWIEKIRNCLELHIRSMSTSEKFFRDCQKVDKQGEKVEDLMSFDELQAMEEFVAFSEEVQSLVETAPNIIPLNPMSSNFIATAMTDFHTDKVSIENGNSYKINYDQETWSLLDSNGLSSIVQPILFCINPPDQEAINIVKKLEAEFVRLKELFEKINFKDFDHKNTLHTLLQPSDDLESADSKILHKVHESGALRKHSSPEDIELLVKNENESEDCKEGTKLQDSNESLKKIKETHANLQRELNDLCQELLPRDFESHAELKYNFELFEDVIRQHGIEIENVCETFDDSHTERQENFDKTLTILRVYGERLQAVGLTLLDIENVSKITGELRSKLISFSSMPSDFNELQRCRSELMDLKTEAQIQKALLNGLFENLSVVKSATKNTRPKSVKNPDLDSLEEQCNQTAKNFELCCDELSERFSKCETACKFLEKYKIPLQSNTNWIDELDSKLKDLEEYEAKGNLGSGEDLKGKHSQCLNALDDLNAWLDQVVAQISSQEDNGFDLDSLLSWTQSIMEIKGDVDNHNKIVNSTKEMISTLMKAKTELSENDVLKQLQNEMSRIEERYTFVCKSVDQLLNFMHETYEELNRFKTEFTDFKIWIDQSFETMDNFEKQLSNVDISEFEIDPFKDFVKDVLGKRADLKFINISFQKLQELKQDSEKVHQNISNKPIRKDCSKAQESLLNDLDDVSQQYNQLVLESNDLSDLFSKVNLDLQEYRDRNSEANHYLEDLEQKVFAFEKERVADEILSQEIQLQRLNNLQVRILEGEKVIGEFKKSSFSLLEPFDEKILISSSSKEEIINAVGDIEERFKQAHSFISKNFTNLDSESSQNRGLEATLDYLQSQLDNIELQMKKTNRPISLIREHLDKQLDETNQIQSDIQTLNSYIQKANQDSISSSAHETEKVLNELRSRYLNLKQQGDSREDMLEKLSGLVGDFDSDVKSLIKQFNENNVDGEDLENLIAQIQPQVEALIAKGNHLVSTDYVSDTESCIEKIEMIENLWKELLESSDERKAHDSARKLSSQKYELLGDQINSKLTKMEVELEEMVQPCFDLDILKQQEEDLNKVKKEYDDQGQAIQTLKKIFDEVLDFQQPNETETFPSKFQETCVKFEIIGKNIASKNADLKTAKNEVEKILESLNEIQTFLNEQERKLPKEPFANERVLNEQQRKLVREISDQFQESQPKFEEIKISLRDFLKKNSSSEGIDELAKDSKNIAVRWKDVKEKCRHISSHLDKLKEFYETLDGLSNWLNSKSRLLRILGPASFDPRMIQSQLNQILVIEEEFQEKNGSKEFLSLIADSLKHEFEDQADDIQRSEKLSQFNLRWEDELKELKNCENKLSLLERPSNTFFHTSNQLHENLGKISDNLDEVASIRETIAQKLNTLSRLGENIESQEPLLSELRMISKQLETIVSDPGFISEVNTKLSYLERKLNNCKRKLENCTNSQDSAAKEENDFYSACQKLQDTLKTFESILSKDLLISGIRGSLLKQVEDFECVYVEIMACEHEVVMIVEKSKNISSKSEKPEIQETVQDLEKGWLKTKRIAKDQKLKLQTSMELNNKFFASLEKLKPWIDKIEAECSDVNPISFSKLTTQKQEKELHAVRNDLNRHSLEFEALLNAGNSFLDACDTEEEEVLEELDKITKKWDNLNLILAEREEAITNVMARLTSFHDNTKDIKNNLQRAEDRLSSLHSVPHHERNAENIQMLIKNKLELEKLLNKVGNDADEIINYANELGSDAAIVRDETDDLKVKIDNFAKSLDRKAEEMEDILKLTSLSNEKLKAISNEISNLDDELAKMEPTGRDLETLAGQQQKIDGFLTRVESKKELIEEAIQLINQLEMKTNNSKSDELKELLRGNQNQLAKLNERGIKRKEDVDKMKDKIELFVNDYNDLQSEIQSLVTQEKTFGALGSDIEQIRLQQDELKNFQVCQVDEVNKYVMKINRIGQELVQTASSEISTYLLESDLEKMNELWNNFKKSISEREKMLDLYLMQSGQFKEALSGLIEWFNEMDEMIEGQKAPSSDFKVIKAQIQEQKFVAKLLGDRKSGIDSLTKMGREIMMSAEEQEKRNIEAQIAHIEGRFDNLRTKSSDRMILLEKAIHVSKEYHEKLGPLEKWLDQMGRGVISLKMLPGDEIKVQKTMSEQNELHKQLTTMKNQFDELSLISQNLIQIVNEDDAKALVEKIEDLIDNYSNLVDESQMAGDILQRVFHSLCQLSQISERFINWMEKTEKDLSELEVLSVYPETLLVQISKATEIRDSMESGFILLEEVKVCGNELIMNLSKEEAMRPKEKIDFFTRNFEILKTKAELLLQNQRTLFSLIENFHQMYNQTSDWLTEVEEALLTFEDQEEEMKNLEENVISNKVLVETILGSGSQICQISPGDGSKAIEELATRINRRYETICEKIQKRNERLQKSIQRSVKVIQGINELLDWYREAEAQIKDADPPSSDSELLKIQLLEHKALNDDIACQKGRTKDVISSAKKILRESSQNKELDNIKEKLDDLNEVMGSVIQLSNNRLSVLEQALPLLEHFDETLCELKEWLELIEKEALNQLIPGMRPDQIAKQQEINRSLRQSIQDHKSVLDRLNKSGGALMKLVFEDDATQIRETLNSINQRYNALKNDANERQQTLEEAMHECFQFSDKLEGMLNALANTADQIKNPEPISANPEKIKEQMEDNNAIISDLAKKEAAYGAVKKVAADIIEKAPNKNDQAIVDIKKKLERLNNLWDQIQKATKERSETLEDALALSEKFWDELQQVMANLKTIQDSLVSQDPPDIEPNTIKSQQLELKGIKEGIENSKSGVEKCRETGNQLINLIGNSEKPELQRHIEDLDNAWDNVTTVYARKEKNILEALEKAMEFHNTLQSFLTFLTQTECKFDNLGHIAMDLDVVKSQIEELKKFKSEVDPWMVNIEALNRHANDLSQCTSSSQIKAIKEPLVDVNCRWDDLNKAINTRQKELEHALLHLGQLQHALGEILVWVDFTDKTLDSLKPVFGDPSVIDVELAKLKVMVNDIHAHQSSIDTLNDASRQIIDLEKGSLLASQTQQTVSQMNSNWNKVLEKAKNKQIELEDALKEAQVFSMEIQDMLTWLDDIDSALSSAKPVGGLPETAKDQLSIYMELYKELDNAGPKIDSFLESGRNYLKRSKEGSPGNLQHNLKILKSKWENAVSKANDKKIKLEIALKEASEFHETLQTFIDWLTNSEKVLSNLKPVSKVLENVKSQIEEHKEFQGEVSLQRETMQRLDKKGTHLKYFSQKQDVILIKNLLASVQYRWEKIVSKSAERTRALDYGYKEAREFHEAWETLNDWLYYAAEVLNQLSTQGKNDPAKIKKEIEQHKEFQMELSSKQPDYDFTMKCGKNLKDKAQKSDEPILNGMLTELKNKWLQICNSSVEKQRKLEEALLFSGQFRDALKALMIWSNKMIEKLDENTQVHGDLDTVMSLIEAYNGLDEELKGRVEQVKSLKQTAEKLLLSADKEDCDKINSEMSELGRNWELLWTLANRKQDRLNEALKKAEELHKSVNMLLEWLSDAEMKLRFFGPLSEDELEVMKQIQDHEKFLEELQVKEKEKDHTLFLTDEILLSCSPEAETVIKQWITIIQSRWDEVASWAAQRYVRLQDHLKELKELLALMEELLLFLTSKEKFLLEIEQESLPDDLDEIKVLIEEHQNFLASMTSRQGEIASICKQSRAKTVTNPIQKRSRSTKFQSNDTVEDSHDNETPRKTSRSSWGSKSISESYSSPRFTLKKKSSFRLETSQEVKSPRTKPLWDKWNQVWQMAREYDQRLKDKQSYLVELERVKHFDWDDWRKLFLKHHNNKKSRVSDLFRKLDEDGDGFLARENFVDGLLKTKLLSSKLELNAVADKFDHGEAVIDWREFMAALRPDWQDRGLLSDAERIDDEINRQVALCSCKQKFKVFQVGEGKYRFGDSQKLRLVRILRSTVMVRVGGGWAGLEEFLLKNDPCRAKGRTNIELREQFILASGVSQAMTPFRSRPSFIGQNPDIYIAKTQGQRLSVVNQGSKERVTQMSGRASFNSGASYVETQFSINPRRQTGLTGNKSISRPPSQAGSNISLDSDNSSLRGGTIRRTSSVRSGARSSLAGERSKGRPEVYTPLGFGSSVARKWSTPQTNGRTKRNSSSDRTPLAGRMRSKSYITPRPSDLINSTSATNIPKFIGCYSSNNNSATSTPARSRTPSSSNIPVPISQRNRATLNPQNLIEVLLPANFEN